MAAEEVRQALEDEEATQHQCPMAILTKLLDIQLLLLKCTHQSPTAAPTLISLSLGMACPLKAMEYLNMAMQTLRSSNICLSNITSTISTTTSTTSNTSNISNISLLPRAGEATNTTYGSS